MTEDEKPREETLLLVDDEANILSSLRRLLRPVGYRIFTAEGGRAGLEILEKENIDLVISDMRMPEMSGAEFLQHVADRWPNSVRILLTGYADLSSTIDAINRGHIYRYVSKPWEDNDLRLTIRQALEQQALKRERERLVALVAKQNRELKDLNAGLEAKVRARTEEIQQTADMLDLAYQELKRSYRETIPVFANLIEMREGDAAGHSRRVAEVARAVAQAMGLDEDQVQNVYFAGLLHDLGKIGLPDELFRKPFVQLSIAERRQFMRHPIMAQASLMAIEPLQEAGRLIRHHQEKFDGSGFPDQLKGTDIPLGSRILAAASDFDSLQIGTLVEGQLTADEARAFLQTNRGTRYDPDILDVMLPWLEANPELGRVVNALRLTSADLRPGMVLARDLVNQDGILLLAQGRVIDGRLIDRIDAFEREEGHGFTIYVKREGENGSSPHHDH